MLHCFECKPNIREGPELILPDIWWSESPDAVYPDSRSNKVSLGYLYHLSCFEPKVILQNRSCKSLQRNLESWKQTIKKQFDFTFFFHFDEI